MRDAEFGTARRIYDRDGRLESVVYPDGANGGFPGGVLVRYERDARGLLTAIIDPVAGTWRYFYDAAGRPVEERSPNGMERHTSYTPEGFLAAVELRRSGTLLERFAYEDYDALGNPRRMTSGEGTTLVTYDARSQIKSARYRAGSAGELSEDFAYDLVGNRREHTRNGVVRRYDIDDADQLTAIRDGAGAILESFTNDAAGRRRTRQVSGQATTSYDYDSLGRLTSVQSGSGAATGLSYDPTGSRRQRRQGAALEATYHGEWLERRGSTTRRLVHADGIDAVVAEIEGSTVHPLVQDGHANVVRVDDGQPGLPERQPANGSFEGSTASGVPEGWEVLPISAAHGAWAFDPQVAYASGSASMRIDITDTVSQASGTLVNGQKVSTLDLYLRSGWRSPPEPSGTRKYKVSACFKTLNQVAPSAQVVLTAQKPNGSGGVTALGSVVLLSNAGTHDWQCQISSGAQGVLDLSSEPTAEVRVYARVNEAGHGTAWVDNIRIIPLDASNQPTQVKEEDVGLPAASAGRRYEAFGTPRSTPSAYPTERGFAGRPVEGSTGLVNLRARHYDPSTGRFLQSDPLGLASSQSYAYAANNPYVYWDPSGLDPVGGRSTGGNSVPGYAQSAGARVGYRLEGTGYVLAQHDQAQGGLQPGDITRTMQAGEILRGYDVRSTISKYGSEIEGAASDYGVDANLFRAIIYEEQTHLLPLVESGLAERVGIGRTVGLGQVTVGYYGYSRGELLDPATNIRAMGIHLSTMGYFPPIDPAAAISSAGTRYNSMTRTSISPYGRRVEFYYGQFSRGVWP